MVIETLGVSDTGEHSGFDVEGPATLALNGFHTAIGGLRRLRGEAVGTQVEIDEAIIDRQPKGPATLALNSARVAMAGLRARFRGYDVVAEATASYRDTSQQATSTAEQTV